MKRDALVIAAIILFSLVATRSLYSQQKNRCDADCVRTVRALLSESSAGSSTGWGEKANHRLGDKVSIAIRKIYKGKGLTDPKNVRAYLPLIRAAFAYPKLIEQQEDRDPTASLRLLQEVESKMQDESLRKEIIEAIKFISADRQTE